MDNHKITAERIADLEKLENSGLGPAAGKAIHKLIFTSMKLASQFENMPASELTTLEKEFMAVTKDAAVSMVIVGLVSRK